MEALKKGVPMDLMFQSLAGSQKSNEAFGINVKLMDEAYELMQEKKSSMGPNFMYFETGQGSELSSEGHNGADQLTMEARCYGLAKRYKPFLVNTVVGFIGPEYLYDGRQIIRAGLEDHFMGKLTGLPMGVDVCYTNHMKADQNDLENLAVILAAGECTYFMGIPGGDDVMLMYQTTSYHDIAALREITGKTPIKEFARRMEQLGILKDGRLTERAGDLSIFTM
jgi:ethanolamine ammonia-lyase large subunit